MGLARKFLAEALLGVTILTGVAHAQERPKAPDTPESATLEHKTPDVDPETARRNAIRDALLLQARRDFLNDTAAFSPSAYSRELKALQDHVTEFLKKNDGRIRDRAIVVDPRKFAEGLALGLGPRATALVLLAAQEAPAGNLIGTAIYGGGSYEIPKYRIDTYSPVPAALGPADKKKVSPCVLIPTSDFALQGRVPQLTVEEDREYTNRHESWHCMDYSRSLRAFSDRDINAVDEETIAESVKNKTHLRIFSIEYNKEAFADVAALGDMVRAGHGMDVIDKIIEWRSRKTEGLQHRSMPVLEALKKDINAIGLGAFRAMPDEQAHGVYYTVMEQHGMTAKNIQVALKYGHASGKHKAKFDRAAAKDPEVANGIIFSSILYPTEEAEEAAKRPETAKELAIAATIAAWPALDTLKGEAFRESGKITPATLIRAYETLLDGLHAQMKENPADPLTDLRMTKLQQVFIDSLTTIDYVAANAEFGVDIVKAEPSLQKFSVQVAALKNIRFFF
ncbi:MAG: hypothetical protein EPN97_16410 [Alphaproteobacteria bacterium]|nr:MAG: hypothetical protein EPN97_16410 [Alphaproteobacteria bacterium]